MGRWGKCVVGLVDWLCWCSRIHSQLRSQLIRCERGCEQVPAPYMSQGCPWASCKPLGAVCQHCSHLYSQCITKYHSPEEVILGKRHERVGRLRGDDSRHAEKPRQAPTRKREAKTETCEMHCMQSNHVIHHRKSVAHRGARHRARHRSPTCPRA